MEIKRVPSGKVMVLEVSGKIMSVPHLELFKAEVKELIDAQTPHVLLDLAEVPWLNSTGLGALITIHQSLTAADGTLKMCNLSERVLSIFRVSGLQRVFEVHPDRDRALASYS